MLFLKNKISIYSIAFFVCVSITYLNNYELTFFLWFLTFILSITQKYSVEIIKYVLSFGLILFTAFIVSIFKNESIFNTLRDIAYLLKPIIGILIGYQLFKKHPKEFFKTIIYSGVLLSVIHLIIVLITFFRFYTISVNLLREYCGYHSDYEIYVLIILVFYKKLEIYWNKKMIYFFIVIVSLSSFLYLSRTNFIQFVILFISLKGYFVLNKRALIIISSILVFSTIGYTIIYQLNPKRGGKGIEAFLYKVKIAPIEAFKTKINKEDWKDFNDNYRSFENILTIKQVNREGSFGVMFGKGLGSTINLGRKIWTNDGEFIQYIPILHNGFATIYLKSGLVGLFFLFLTIYLIGKPKPSSVTIIKNLNFLLLGSAIFLVFSSWVFMGFYLKLDNKSILIGALIGYRELLSKKINNNNHLEYNENIN